MDPYDLNPNYVGLAVFLRRTSAEKIADLAGEDLQYSITRREEESEVK